MNETSIDKIIDLLEKAYGPLRKKDGDDPIAVLVQTILSQNTSDTNSDRAFARLIGYYRTWQELAEAPLNSISRLIKEGGLSSVKAKYIKSALNEIKKRHGKLELDFLRKLPMDEARIWLLQLPGVGLKTANCVLLFSFDMPALPVDTHVYRVARRLGLINDGISIEQANKILEEKVPANRVYEFHLLFIEHGRKTCHARNPLCAQCVLNRICPYFATLSS